MVIMNTGLAGCGSNAKEASVADAVDDNYRNYYEIFVYSFYDSDGDGIGDLKGVEEKLDYIAELGCNGIWLMPVMPSTTYHKYDVTDYKAIDPEYGSIEDYEALIKAAHDKHIRVIIDMVINHTSSKHPWFTEAVDYLSGLKPGEEPDSTVCPYVDYYHFSKDKKDNTWYQAGNTDFYYEGSFWSEMPDLNLSNEALMGELEDAAAFWIEIGTDGFRMDAPLHYEESATEFNTGILNELYEYCRGQNPDFYMVSEVWASEQTIEDYYKSETPSMFDFTFAQAEGDIVKSARGKEKAERFVTRMVENEEKRAENNPEYINAPFITNHDMPRVSNALNGKTDDMKLAAAMLLSMSGSPYIYYGEELGMSSKGTKDENKRLPMLWSVEDKKGMCRGPSDADQGIEQKCEPADMQIEDEDSLYNVYKKGFAIRNANPEIARGKTNIIHEITRDDLAIVARNWNDNTVYIIYNTSEDSAELSTEILTPDTGREHEYKLIGTLSSDGTDGIMEQERLIVPPRSVTYIR